MKYESIVFLTLPLEINFSGKAEFACFALVTSVHRWLFDARFCISSLMVGRC